MNLVIEMKIQKNKTTFISFRPDHDLVEKLMTAKNRLGWTMTKVLDAACRHWLQKQKP